MQWLEDPNQRNVDNLNDLRREASRHFMKKKGKKGGGGYLKAKIDELEPTGKIQISETCIWASMTLRGVASPELI